MGITLNALLDTGSSKSYISEKTAKVLEKAGITAFPSECQFARVANGARVQVGRKFVVPCQANQKSYLLEASVFPGLGTEVIIGLETMRNWKITIQAGINSVQWEENRQPEKLLGSNGTQVSAIKPLAIEEAAQIQRFLEEELPKFDHIQGPTDLAEHVLRLKPGAQPTKHRYLPRNPAMQQVINEEVDKMLQAGVIEPSHSPWSSPVLLVKKPTGKYRFCIDLRKVNNATVKDAYPLPQVQAILDRLKEAKVISTLDLKDGYWQVPLHPESRPLTAFTAPSKGLFQFRVMPFGLHSAPATFQRLLDYILGPELDDIAFAYLDDIIVLGTTVEEHIRNLRLVFERLRAAKLQLNLEKCKFAQTELKYLGHVVNSEGINTDPEKVRAVREFPAPQTVRQLRSFLGLAGWYKRFVPDYSKVTAPMNKLLRKGVNWEWNAQANDAFKNLKNLLTQAPVLACPDYTQQFFIQTDASDVGLGATLFQKIDGLERTIAFSSRTLHANERKFSATEKECLAVLYALRKYRPYIEGYKVKVITDHQALKWLHNLKSPSGRLTRWVMEMQQYDFEVEYRKGAMNRVADALSRTPMEPKENPSTSNIEEEGYAGEITALKTTPSWYTKMMKNVQRSPDKFPRFTVRSGLLYKKIWNNVGRKEGPTSSPWKLCLSKEEQPKILTQNHDDATAGHLGIAKTFDRIAKHYYWPGMFRDIAKYVRSCNTCQKFKLPSLKPQGEMQFRRTKGPWTTVSTDLVGPFPRSTKGNKYLVMFQDSFTKWVECAPIRSATAKAVEQVFRERVVLRYGTPEILISDNGTQYTSHLFTEIAKRCGIHHRFTPPYTPQANPVERTNKVMEVMIAQYLEETQKKWDALLPEFMFALNTATHSSTGFSPAYLNYGRELRTPEMLTLPVASEEIESPNQRVQDMKDIYLLVRRNLEKAHDNQRHHYNLRRRKYNPKVGDYVFCRERPLSSAVNFISAKLLPKFSGPHYVSKIISPVVIEVIKEGKPIKVHVKDVKACNNGGVDVTSRRQ